MTASCAAPAAMSPTMCPRTRCMATCCARRTPMRAFAWTRRRRARMPGVRLLLTAADISELGPMPCVAVPAGIDLPVPIYPVLARERCATSAMRSPSSSPRRSSRRAMRPRRSRSSGSRCRPRSASRPRSSPARRWCGRGRAGNLAFETTLGDEAATERAFAAAERTVSLTRRQPAAGRQLSRHPRRGRRSPTADRITLTLSSQGSHAVRDIALRPTC